MGGTPQTPNASQLSPLERLLAQPDQQTPPPAPAQDSQLSPLEKLMNAPDENTATISAVHEPTTFLGKFGRWAENVSNDIKYGTDQTGIGTILKKMGAHGVYAGNPEAVGDFMASLPLGLLKSAKGTTEVSPHVIGGPEGKTWQGLKDVVGGGLQAATIPSVFVAPEVSELSRATEGAEAGGEGTGLVSQIRKGESVSQPGTRQAIREGTEAAAEHTGTGASAGEDILKGNRTVVDDHLDALTKRVKDAYKTVDDTVGFDLKQLRDKVATDEYNLKQLGSSDPDKTGRLIEAINENKDRITQAEDKLQQAGINPKGADSLNKSLMAGKEFKKLIVKATNTDGAVDLDKLVEGSKALRFSKYGDRLSQFMGKDGAEKYMGDLDKMQKLGVHAIKRQKAAELALRYGAPLVAGGAGAAIYGAAKAHSGQ